MLIIENKIILRNKKIIFSIFSLFKCKNQVHKEK